MNSYSRVVSVEAGAIAVAAAAVGFFVLPVLFQSALHKRFEPVPEPANYPKATNQLEAERQDLDYIKQLMDLDHSISPTNRKRFEKERTALLQRSQPLTTPQFQLAIDHLVTIANNGHTSALASQQAGSFGRAQVRFAWFSDGLYIVRSKSDAKFLLGARVLGPHVAGTGTFRRRKYTQNCPRCWYQ